MTPAEKQTLVLEPVNHIYTLEPAGQRLPSLTAVLQDVGIIDYSMISPIERERAMRRGRFVHVATAYYDEGTLDDATVAPEIRPYVEAWKHFRRDHDFEPGTIEQPIWHRSMLYACTPDRIGSWYGAPCVLEIKTGGAEWWAPIQTAAQAKAAFSADQIPTAHVARLVVELSAEGVYRMPPALQRTGYDNPLGDFAPFAAALRLYRLKRWKKL